MTVTRFAPSPTGYLHLGHVHSALRGFQAARQSAGRFLLRIEDIDSGRCRPEFERAIYEDLAWLGFDWEKPVRRQSEHFADYNAALEHLRAKNLLYPCFCTRAEIADEISRSPSAPQGPEGFLYPGICRRLPYSEREDLMASGKPFALRLHIEHAVQITGSNLNFNDHFHGGISAQPAQFGDVVLARKDIPASYHLAVTIDDALQGITLVTRGEDLLPSTHLHRLLQALLDLPTPGYAHHKLLTDAQGRRLAKRDQAMSLRSLRAQGYSPVEIRQMVENHHPQ